MYRKSKPDTVYFRYADYLVEVAPHTIDYDFGDPLPGYEVFMPDVMAECGEMAAQIEILKSTPFEKRQSGSTLRFLRVKGEA